MTNKDNQEPVIKQRIMPGIIQIAGEHDTGKTTAALECGATPDQIAFFDDDVKGRATVNDMRASGIEFGYYVDLTELGTGKQLVEFHEACLAEIEKLEAIAKRNPEKIRVIIWDTWARFASTCRLYVMRYPEKFRAPGGVSRGGEWSDMGTMKGAELNAEAKIYESRLLNRLQAIAPTVIIVSHLKTYYYNNRATDKQVPATSDTFERVPRLRLWLRQNPSGSPVPVALVLKRLDKKLIVDGKIRSVCVLPRKITPNETDQSIWDTIWRYWDNPIDLRPQEDYETPTEEEIAILDGTLTEEQKLFLKMALAASANEEPSITPDLDFDTTRIKELDAQGLMPKEIAETVGLTVDQVNKILTGK